MTVLNDGLPVVIVAGAARAGTAAVSAGIAAAAGYEAVEAGPTFGLLWTLTAALRGYEAALAPFEAALAPGPVQEAEPWLRKTVLKDFLDRLPARDGYVLRAANLLPGVPALHALPVAAAAIPSARCVHVRRNGIDFVQSRMRVLPEVDFAAHCLAWIEDAEAWAAMKGSLGRRALEVEQGRLSASPDAVAAELGAFLGWSEEARTRFVSAVRMRRLGRSGVFGGARGPTLADVSWSYAEKEVFSELCGEAMEAAGYPLDREGAMRRQPLRLTECLAAWEGRPLTGCAIGLDRQDRSAVALTPAAEGGEGVALVVPCLSLGSRTRFEYRAAALEGAADPVHLRMRIRESLSRREVAELSETVPPGTPASGTLSLAATPELVDVEITVRPAGTGGAGAGLRLLDATFRHAANGRAGA
ncbi:hypothetical protein [Methylobacterium sp. sgz302541]|uniref:hypothetical protein n=1 Tax=unclassified Methylobacterium TaxID=2615210 RepID=UPI003D34FEA3